ncbi:hypothetical protein EZI45_23900 [Delftia tsuruhatensis]|uniref:hypothetical protein n=1 Tax=Delftia tsuruhatensis TaxID=180282 RepID=UPI001055A129|nr:hypothetical protein [Delftia tsuruhatensis]TDF23826.1 hypothetical protein EZI45_23900 [Delftia tsuruhatensis]
MIGKHGTLTVSPVPKLDTYVLEFQAEGSEHRLKIAMHPNGYTCHAVATRILGAWEGRCGLAHVMKQFDYVLACGGMGLARGSVEFIAKGLPRQ